jgi:hypothetical protein
LELGWCAPDSVVVAEVIEQRLAQRSHRGCGRGGGRGPSPAGRPESANDVEGSGAGDGPQGPRFAESRSMADGVSGRGNRRSSRGGGESGLGLSIGRLSLPFRRVTEVSESRRFHRPWSANRRPRSWAAGRSGRRDVKRVVHGEGSSSSHRRSQTEPGCSSLKCGLQMSAGRISGGAS